MQIVNGYVCQTCCDVTAAKAGKDPAHPNAPPDSDGAGKTGRAHQTGKTDQMGDATQGASAASAPTQNSGQPGFSPNAVTFGGALGQANASSPVLADVIAAYQQGGAVNLTA